MRYVSQCDPKDLLILEFLNENDLDHFLDELAYTQPDTVDYVLPPGNYVLFPKTQRKIFVQTAQALKIQVSIKKNS